MTTISIIADPEIGGTFLAWSLHYLAGDTEYYLSKHSFHSEITNHGIKKLPNNPLTKINAHNFYPNQFQSITDQLNLYKELKKSSKFKNNIVYNHNLVSNIGNAESINLTLENSDKIILLKLSDKDLLYNCKFELRAGRKSKFDDPKIIINDSDEFWKHYLDHYFHDSLTQWKDLNLNNAWDLREFLAINLKQYIFFEKITDHFNLNESHYQILSTELWNVLNIKLLFEYLDIAIDTSRVETWNVIYNEWRQIHSERILFVTYFDTIIDYILNDYYLDLSRFNLDIIQEATIQHTLLYKHNLNLKTWQLDKFQDTRQLHSLLEPNTHHHLGTF